MLQTDIHIELTCITLRIIYSGVSCYEVVVHDIYPRTGHRVAGTGVVDSSGKVLHINRSVEFRHSALTYDVGLTIGNTLGVGNHTRKHRVKHQQRDILHLRLGVVTLAGGGVVARNDILTSIAILHRHASTLLHKVPS